MNLVKSIWGVLGKAWQLFITVIVPTMKNKDKVMESIENFSNLVTAQYPSLLEQLKQVIADYFDMSQRVKELYDERFSLTDQLNTANAISCKAAPTCKNVLK